MRVASIGNLRCASNEPTGPTGGAACGPPMLRYSTSGGQNNFSSVRVKIPCRGGVRRGEIMAPRPSGGAKIWCHHRPLSRKRTVVVGKSNQSLLLSLPPTHYPNSSQSQKNLLVLDVLGLLHQEALALKKSIGILGLGRLNRHVVESGKK